MAEGSQARERVRLQPLPQHHAGPGRRHQVRLPRRPVPFREAAPQGPDGRERVRRRVRAHRRPTVAELAFRLGPAGPLLRPQRLGLGHRRLQPPHRPPVPAPRPRRPAHARRRDRHRRSGPPPACSGAPFRHHAAPVWTREAPAAAPCDSMRPWHRPPPVPVTLCVRQCSVSHQPSPPAPRLQRPPPEKCSPLCASPSGAEARGGALPQLAGCCLLQSTAAAATGQGSPCCRPCPPWSQAPPVLPPPPGRDGAPQQRPGALAGRLTAKAPPGR